MTSLARFPLRVAPGGRHLVDADERPFLMQGDSSWSLFSVPTLEEVDEYLADRAARGFNAVVADLIEALIAHDPPRNRDGEAPFIVPGDLGTPNEAYFARCDRIIERAAARGMLLLLEPCYLGYRDPHWREFRDREEGWYREVLANGVEGCRAYGRYLGERYRSAANILWVMSGDRDPGDAREHVDAMAEGIQDAAPGHRLFTAHVHPGHRPVEEFAGSDWLTVNATYSYEIVHRDLLEEHRRPEPRPNFLFESSYEHMHAATTQQIRRQAWWPMTCGAFGQVMGNDPLFWFGPGWRSQLDSQGTRAMQAWRAFWDPLPWWRLVPDVEGRIVTGWRGAVAGLERVTAAVTPDGDLAVAYLPVARAVDVDLGRLSGPTVEASWFDPASGTRVPAGRHEASRVVTLRSPFPEDAALLLRQIPGPPDDWATGRPSG
jgi:hypothetical protein